MDLIIAHTGFGLTFGKVSEFKQDTKETNVDIRIWDISQIWIKFD